MLSFFQNEVSAAYKGVEWKKHRSKQQIIRYLFLTGEGTCNKIAKQIHLSTPSVQASINELVKVGVVMDKGQGISTGGRRPNIYGLRKDSFYILCIDVRRYMVRIVLVNSHMKTLGQVDAYDIPFRDDMEYMDEVIRLAGETIHKAGVERQKIIGVGMSMPGLIDSEWYQP
jgi:predicted transcriptional regulator